MTREHDHNATIDVALVFIADGESVADACARAGVSRALFYARVDRDQYARARMAAADVLFDELEALERQTLTGELAPQVAKVAMDSRKWRLARMNRHTYGDKSVPEPGGAMSWEDALARIQAGNARPDIDSGNEAAEASGHGLPPGNALSTEEEFRYGIGIHRNDHLTKESFVNNTQELHQARPEIRKQGSPSVKLAPVPDSVTSEVTPLQSADRGTSKTGGKAATKRAVKSSMKESFMDDAQDPHQVRPGVNGRTAKPKAARAEG